MTSRRIVAVLAIALLLAAGSIFARALRTEASAPLKTAHNCSNIQLLIRPDSTNGAAGHIGVIYRIHNMRSGACSLDGFPGVVLLDKNFSTLPNPVHWGGGSIIGSLKPQLVTLDSRHDAFFAAGYTDVPSTTGPCPFASYVMVTPPNDRLPDVTYIFPNAGRVDACGAFDVTPVESTPSYGLP